MFQWLETERGRERLMVWTPGSALIFWIFSLCVRGGRESLEGDTQRNSHLNIVEIEERMRSFLWKGREQANGHGVQGTSSAAYPVWGLVVHDLEHLGWALHICWLWLLKSDTSKPWSGLPILIPRKAQVLFGMAVHTQIGDEESTKFWTDWWLQGKYVAELAPNLSNLIPKRMVKRRTVIQALQNRGWVGDIRGGSQYKFW